MVAGEMLFNACVFFLTFCLFLFCKADKRDEMGIITFLTWMTCLHLIVCSHVSSLGKESKNRLFHKSIGIHFVANNSLHRPSKPLKILTQYSPIYFPCIPIYKYITLLVYYPSRHQRLPQFVTLKTCNCTHGQI